MSIMLKEICEGANAIEATCDSVNANLKAAGDMIRKSDYILIAGSGTSYHSGLSLQISLLRAEIPAIPVKAPDFVNYIPHKFSKKVTVIIISQSGESSDAIAALDSARNAGASTIGITNEKESLLAKESDFSIITSAGHEEAIAATKSYVSQLTAMEKLRGYITNEQTDEKLDSISRWYDDVAQITETLTPTSEKIRNKAVFLGNGYLFTTAMESALKFKETCNLLTDAYQVREYLHGPIQTLDKDTTVIIFREWGKDYSEVINELRKYTDSILTVGSTEKDDIRVPNVDESLYPLAYILPIQIMAYYKAESLNLNPDKPEKLSKVVK